MVTRAEKYAVRRRFINSIENYSKTRAKNSPTMSINEKSFFHERKMFLLAASKGFHLLKHQVWLHSPSLTISTDKCLFKTD